MAFLNTPPVRAATRTLHNTSAFVCTRPMRDFQSPRMPLRSNLIRAMSGKAAKEAAEKDAATLTDAEWRKKLSPQEYHILRQKGTEYPGTGEYDGFYPKEGYFACRGCGQPIYSAAAKFQSGCGWPAFDKCYEGSVSIKKDSSFGMRRVEIMCSNCDGHLGHVFEGERMTDTNERHCVNSMSLKFVDGTVEKKEEKVL